MKSPMYMKNKICILFLLICFISTYFSGPAGDPKRAGVKFCSLKYRHYLMAQIILNYFFFLIACWFSNPSEMNITKIEIVVIIEPIFQMILLTFKFLAFYLTPCLGWALKREVLKEKCGKNFQMTSFNKIKYAHIFTDKCCIF